MDIITDWERSLNSLFFCEKCFKRSVEKPRQNPVMGNTICILYRDDDISNTTHYFWDYLFNILNNKPGDMIVGITPHIFIPIKSHYLKGKMISIIYDVACGVCSAHKTINSLGNIKYVFNSQNKFTLKIKSENWESLYKNRINLSDS